jgi:hypothetical protein
MVVKKQFLPRLFALCFALFFAAMLPVSFTGCGGGTVNENNNEPNPEGDGGTEKTLGKINDACDSAKPCEAGLLCQGGKCAKPECVSDADCAANPNGKKCADYTCQDLGDACQSNAQCPPGQDCVAVGQGKFCKAPEGGTDVDAVLIVTPPGVVRSGQKRQFEAVALNKSGARLVGDYKFNWKAADADVAAIDANGAATGGSKDGETDITAELNGKTSPAVKLRNFAPVEAGKLRVILINASNAFVSGATVKVGDAEAQSDNVGAAVLDNVTLPADIHIFHKSYAYFSAFNVGKNDLLVQLTQKNDNSKAGGIKGEVDFSTYYGIMGIPQDEQASYNVAVGFTSFAIPPDILGLNLDTLLGESFEVDVFGQKFSVPSGVILEALGGGKSEYQTQGDEGKDKLAFALAARLKISDVTPLISEVTGGSGLDIGKILVAVEPLFSKMALGFRTGISVTLHPKIADAQDLNKNGRTDDLIPDFSKFTAVALKVDSKLDKQISVKVAAYPTYQHNGQSVPFYAISLAAVLLPGYGLAPLGIAISEGKDASKALVLRHAEPKGVLRTGRFVILTLALTLPVGDPKPPLLIAGDVQFFNDLPTNVNVGAFIDLPTTAKLDPATRTLSNAGTDRVSFSQIDLSDDNARWIVVYNGKTEVVLPAVPSGFDDPVNADASASLRPVKLQNNLSMDDVLEFNANNMDRFTELLSGFVNVSVYEKP